MTKARTITKAYVRTYSDSNHTVAYVEWSDGSRSEAVLRILDLGPHYDRPRMTFGSHMHALFAAAKANGVKATRERW